MYKSGQTSTKSTFHAVFEQELNDETVVTDINIFPPKMRALRMLMEADIDSASTLSDTNQALAVIMSNNREKKRFTVEQVEEMFDVEDLQNFFADLVDWIDQLKKK